MTLYNGNYAQFTTDMITDFNAALDYDTMLLKSGKHAELLSKNIIYYRNYADTLHKCDPDFDYKDFKNLIENVYKNRLMTLVDVYLDTIE